jgi:hypothetical protein
VKAEGGEKGAISQRLGIDDTMNNTEKNKN